MLATDIDIGELDKRIILLSPTVATGVNRPITNEDEITGWTELAEVWARVKVFKGNEAMIAEKLTETHHLQADIRYRTDVTTRMRFVFETRVYDIVSVAPADDRRRFMTVTGELNDKELWT